jgi:tetratricopeptide (TPR) repeat protein
MFLHVVGAGFLSAQNLAEPESFRRASEAMRRGDLNAAGEGFEAATKASPSFAPAHFNLGLVREEQGRFDEAIASLLKALSLKPGMHGANLFLGIAYYRVNRFEPAIAAAKKETSAYPKDASAWMWQGVIALAMDHAEDAAAALDKAATLAPDSVDILYHRGQAHLLVSKNSYLKMFKVDPKSWRVHQVLAQASAQAERPLDAIAEYQEAIKLAPTQPGLHEELGLEYGVAAKPLEAEAAFQRELEIDPHNALARYEFGLGGGRASVQADVQYTDDFCFTVLCAPVEKEDGYTVLNARIGYGAQDGRWEVALFGDNLSDKEYRVYAFDSSLFAGVVAGVYAKPRTYGIHAIVRFGAGY